MYVLFVDACPRGEGVSRTLSLLHAFEAAFSKAYPKVKRRTLRLDALRLSPIDGEALSRREALIDAARWDDPLFAPAREFMEADGVIVAAPYWDLMFPAMLKVYIEHLFIRELTFCYRDDRPIGLCKPRRALFLTTAGSPIGANDFGACYLQAVFSMLGIPTFDCVRAEGLDIAGANVPEILEKARAETERLAGNWQHTL